MTNDMIGPTRHARLRAEFLTAPAWKNPNAMQPKDYALLRAAISACGGTRLQPVLVRETGQRDRYEVVDGLHRVQACRDELIAEVDAIVLAHGTSNAEAEKVARLLQIGMNRMRGSLDLGAVGDSVKAIDLTEVDAALAALSGFDEPALRALLASTSGPSEEVLLGGTGGGAVGGEDVPADEPTFELKVVFATKKALTAARKALRAVGGGDITAGLLALVEDHKAALRAQKRDDDGKD